MRPVVVLTFLMGAPLDAWGWAAQAECYPLATAIEALVESGTLDEPVFIEEWSVCVGEGLGGPSAVALPDGDHGDTQGILEAVVAAHNAGGGLNYDVRRVGPGWSVAPNDRPRCAEAPIDPVEAGQDVLTVETMVRRQWGSHCEARIGGRAIGTQSLTMIEAPSTTEVLPAATVLATTLALLTDEPNEAVGWSQRLVTVDGQEGAYSQGWRALPVEQPPKPNPFADREPLPPGVKGRMIRPDGSVRHILEDGTIVEVSGPNEDAEDSDEDTSD